MGQINNLKNEGQEKMLGNVEAEEVEECGNKYSEAVARYDILMDQIERKLRSFKEMEK